MATIDSRVQWEVRDLEFPVLLLMKEWLRVYPDAECLTAAWKKAVDREFFDGALLVDSRGRERRVRTVKSLGHIGPFFGFDRFLGRNMRIAYEFAGDWQTADLNSIRTLVLSLWQRWGSSVDSSYSAGYQQRLQAASDVRSVIAILAERFAGRVERTR